jgi:hypothetical protein
MFRKKYRIVRNGFVGPLVVSLSDKQGRHLQGVTGPVLTVPAGSDVFEYPVFLPPWMETGRTSRSCVMLTGEIEEKGVKHTVSLFSNEQNEQVIAVVETGRLALEADVASLAARPGAGAEVPFRLRRGKGLVGPVKVELVAPAHVRGPRAEPVVVPADRSEGRLALRFGAGPLGPFNMPVLVRATLLEGGAPVVAEARLEIVEEEGEPRR